MTVLRSHYPIALLCILLGCAFWWSLRWGVGLSPDSMFYLEQSSALTEAFSISKFEDRAPPLYPLTQYSVNLVVGEKFLSIKVLHSLLYILNTFLFALLVFMVSGGSRWFSILAVLVHAFSPTIYTIHAYALTEPLFVTFFLLALLFVHRYYTTRGARSLVLAGCAVGLMVLTRFAAISFLASISLFLLICQRGERISDRFRQVALFVAPAVLLPLAWTLLKFVFDPSANPPRTLEYHPIPLGKLLQVFHVFSEWLFIDRSLLVFLVLLSLVAHVLYSRLKDGGVVVPACLSFNICFYIAFIAVSISLFDAYTPIDQRIMLPAFYLALLLVLEAAATWLRGRGERMHRTEVGFLALFFVVFGGAATAAAAVENYRYGLGFMSKAMQELELHEVVREREFEKVYTNAPELLVLHVGKTSILLPHFYEPIAGAPNENWVSELGAVLQEVDRGEAAIVYYKAVNWRPYLPSPEFLFEQYDLVPSYGTPEGAIFQRPLR